MSRTMRVLHVNKNFASVMSTNVLAQRSIGLDARGFVFGPQPPIVSTDGLRVMPDGGPLPLRYLWFLKQFLWADIVHWYWGTPILPKGRDLGLLRRLRKPCVIEWLGSDVRRFEVEMLDNPHFRRLWLENEEFRSTWRASETQSRDRQARFQSVGAVSVVHPARRQYMLDLREGHFITAMLGFDLSAFAPRVPDPNTSRPLIVHAPSRRLIKGTDHVLAAIETLRSEGLAFDFHLVEGCAHGEALQALHASDVFVDSLIMGNYGLASIEAMAMGKPAVCYVKESVRREYPASLPIVQAEPDTIATVLRDLLTDGEKRVRLGRESRAYVEQYHDARRNAQAMVQSYQSVIARNSGAVHAADGVLSD